MGLIRPADDVYFRLASAGVIGTELGNSRQKAVAAVTKTAADSADVTANVTPREHAMKNGSYTFGLTDPNSLPIFISTGK